MTPRAYEALVQELISNLAPFRGVEVCRNKRFRGVRQPGYYEVDVALEFNIGDKLRFLLIVEYKRWNRPVGREVIQRLVQTRDAIAAHKAVVCSPMGFTKEAIDVAKAHGIALWVIAAQRKKDLSKTTWRAVCDIDYQAVRVGQVEKRLWKELMRVLAWSFAGSTVPSIWSVRDFHAFPSGFKLNKSGGVLPPEFVFTGDGDPFSDEDLAAYQIFKEIIALARSDLPQNDALRVSIEESFQMANREIGLIDNFERRNADFRSEDLE